MIDVEQTKSILVGLIRVGLLRIRALGYAGDATGCSEEADHIHNLPGIIDSFQLEEVEYYYDISRPSFSKNATTSIAEFDPLWERLGKLLGR